MKFLREIDMMFPEREIWAGGNASPCYTITGDFL